MRVLDLTFLMFYVHEHAANDNNFYWENYEGDN